MLAARMFCEIRIQGLINAYGSTPTPSVSDFAGRNSDHSPNKTQTTPDSVFTRERRNSDQGLSFWEGKTQTMV